MGLLLTQVMSAGKPSYQRALIATLVLLSMVLSGLTFTGQASAIVINPQLTQDQPLEGIAFLMSAAPTGSMLAGANIIPVANTTVMICPNGPVTCNSTAVIVDSNEQGIWYANVTNSSYSSYYITWSAPGMQPIAWNFTLGDLSQSGFGPYSDNGYYLCTPFEGFVYIMSGECPTTLNGLVPAAALGAYGISPAPYRDSSGMPTSPLFDQNFSLVDAATGATIGANTINVSGEQNSAFENLMSSGTAALPLTSAPLYIPAGTDYTAELCAPTYYCDNVSVVANMNYTYNIYLYPHPASSPPAVSYVAGTVMGEGLYGGEMEPVAANVSINYTSGMAPLLWANYTNVSVNVNGVSSANQIVNFSLSDNCLGAASPYPFLCGIQNPYNVAFTAEFPSGTFNQPGPSNANPALSFYVDSFVVPRSLTYFVQLPNTPNVTSSLTLTMWYNENASNTYSYPQSNSSIFGFWADWSQYPAGPIPVDAVNGTYQDGQLIRAESLINPERRVFEEVGGWHGATLTQLTPGHNIFTNTVSGIVFNGTDSFVTGPLPSSAQTHLWRILVIGYSTSAAGLAPELLLGIGGKDGNTNPYASDYTYTGVNTNIPSLFPPQGGMASFNYSSPSLVNPIPSQVGIGNITYAPLTAAKIITDQQWGIGELLVNTQTGSIFGEGMLSPGYFSGSPADFEQLNYTSWIRSGPVATDWMVGNGSTTVGLGSVFTNAYAIPYVSAWPTVTPTMVAHGTEKILGQTLYCIGGTCAAGQVTTVHAGPDGKFLIPIKGGTLAYTHQLYINASEPGAGCTRLQDMPVFLPTHPQNNTTTVNIFLSGCQTAYTYSLTGSASGATVFLNGLNQGQFQTGATYLAYRDYKTKMAITIIEGDYISKQTSFSFITPLVGSATASATLSPTYSDNMAADSGSSGKFIQAVMPKVRVTFIANPNDLPSGMVLPVNPVFKWTTGGAMKPIYCINPVCTRMVPTVDLKTISFGVSTIPVKGPTCGGHFHCHLGTQGAVFEPFPADEPLGLSTQLFMRPDGTGCVILTTSMYPGCNTTSNVANGVSGTGTFGGRGGPNNGGVAQPLLLLPIVKFSRPLNGNFHVASIEVGVIGDNQIILGVNGTLANKGHFPAAALFYHNLPAGGVYNIALSNTTTGNAIALSFKGTAVTSGISPGVKHNYVMTVRWSNYAKDATFTATPLVAQPPLSYSISGAVLSPNGTGISGATVTLQGINGKSVTHISTSTDPSGKFIFTGLQNGTYYLNGSDSTSVYGPVSTNVTISGSNVSKNLNLTAGGSVGTTPLSLGSMFWDIIVGVTIATGVILVLLLGYYQKKNHKWPFKK